MVAPHEGVEDHAVQGGDQCWCGARPDPLGRLGDKALSLPDERWPERRVSGGHQEQLVPRQGQGPSRAEQMLQRSRRAPTLDRADLPVGEVLEEGGDHPGPVTEVVADRPVGDPGGVFNGPHRQAGRPGPAEQLQRLVEQSPSGFLLHLEKSSATFFSMWRIEGELDQPGTPYDRRAALYDRLVRSPLYNRVAWSTSPEEYSQFAATAIASSDGPLLEVAAGSAAATAELHARSTRPTVLVDLSRPMLERAAERIAAVSGLDDQALPPHLRLVQADLFALSFPPHGFDTVLGLGLTHLFDDLPGLVTALRRQAAPGGQVHLAGLVAETRRGRRYLQLLHRAGHVAEPRTASQLNVALGQPASFGTIGCMAYTTLAAD